MGVRLAPHAVLAGAALSSGRRVGTDGFSGNVVLDGVARLLPATGRVFRGVEGIVVVVARDADAIATGTMLAAGCVRRGLLARVGAAMAGLVVRRRALAGLS